jgi:hypothetical protein
MIKDSQAVLDDQVVVSSFEDLGEGISGRDVVMVGQDGLEPSTLRLSGVRSNHLSY